MRQGDGLRNVSDLKNFTLLHSNYAGLDAGWPDWAMWLKVVDAEDVDSSHGIFFNQSDLMFQAALDGQGEITLRTRATMNFTIGDIRHAAVASIEIEDDGPGIPQDLQDAIFYQIFPNIRNLSRNKTVSETNFFRSGMMLQK